MIIRGKQPGESLYCTKCGTLLFVPEDSTSFNDDLPDAEVTIPNIPELPKPVLHSIRFTGDGTEYFKIWIMNLFLTIITFGIYSAWAKVRTKRYFYGNTLLDGTPFEYNADPIRILIGRLIAFLLLAIAYITRNTVPWASLVTIVVGFCFMPWLIYKSLRFNARYSSYRNINFAFTGTVSATYGNFFLWQLLGMLVGLVKPVADYNQTNFVVSNYRYGKTSFSYSGSIGKFYEVFGITFAMGIGAYIIAIPLFMALGSMGGTAPSATNTVTLIILAFLAGFAALFIYAYTKTKKVELLYNYIQLNYGKVKTSLKFLDVFKLYVVNYLLLVFTVGIATPWVMVRNARYMTENIHVELSGGWDQFEAGDRTAMGAIGEEVGDVFNYDFDIGL